MAYSFKQYTGDGATDTFSVTFAYLSQADVHVYIGGVEDTAYTWSSSTIVQTSTVPGAGVVVEVRRITDRSARVVDFIDASNLTEALLDLSADQQFYIAQEVLDLTDTAILLDSDSKYDANSKVIKNVANAVNDNDAVNLTTLLGYYTATVTPTAANIQFVPEAGINDLNVQDAIVTAKKAAAAAALALGG